VAGDEPKSEVKFFVWSELLAQSGLSLLAQSKVRTEPWLRPNLIRTYRLSPLGL